MSLDATEQAAKQAIDVSVGIGALTWPWWVQALQTTGYVVTFLGGLVLLALRILIAWHELKSKRATKSET